MRSMDATGRRVAGVFWTEVVALVGLAWLVAVVLGIPAAVGFQALLDAVLLPIPFAFSPAALLTLLVFTLIIASLASVIPALGAARGRIVETLRYERPASTVNNYRHRGMGGFCYVELIRRQIYHATLFHTCCGSESVRSHHHA